MANISVPPSPEKQRSLDAKGEALLQQLVAATPAQIDTYLTANLTTVAQARPLIKSMLLAIRYLYLRGPAP